METPADVVADLFKDYEAADTAENEGLALESHQTPEFPAIKINQVTSIPQEDFPAIEIEGATSISEAAFLENHSIEENEGEGSGAEAVEITAMQTEVEEAQQVEEKEQEAVNEVEEDHVGCGEVVKRELEEGDDGPNEDPNRDNTDSDQEMDPEVAAALKVSCIKDQIFMSLLLSLNHYHSRPHY